MQLIRDCSEAILKTSSFGILVIASTVLCKSTIAADNEWTGWLGPDRNGWVAGFEIPESWPAELQQEWQVEVGDGYGTPLVDGTRVFVHSRIDDENESLFCIDLQTGETIWKRKFAVPFKVGGGGEWHGKCPKSNPLLAEGRLFTMSISGFLTAWDAATGRQLWRKNYADQFDSNHPYWGFSSSPIADDGKVFMRFGGDEQGLLVALDIESGDEIWTLGNDGASYSSPLIAEFFGVRQLVEWNHNVVAGVDLDTGTQLWKFPFPHVGTNQNMPTPSILDGHILVGGENRGVRSIKPHLSRIDSQDVWTATEQWHQKEVALDMSSTVVNDGLLFGFSHYGRGRIFCLDPKNGNVQWTGPPRTGQNVTFLATPGYVVALIDNGRLQFIHATAEKYDLAKEYKVAEEPCWAAPVLLESRVLIKTRKFLKLLKF